MKISHTPKLVIKSLGPARGIGGGKQQCTFISSSFLVCRIYKPSISWCRKGLTAWPSDRSSCWPYSATLGWKVMPKGRAC